MKKSIKIAYQFLAVAFVVILGGCSEDTVPGDLDSEVRKEGNETISCFNLNRAAFRLPDAAVDVTTRLISVNQEETDSLAAESDTINLPTKISFDNNKIRVEMRIPEEVVLDDEYLLTLHRAPGVRRYVGGVRATFEGNRLCRVGAEAEPYRGLEGEGTEESPYLIGSTDDFLSFLNNLRRDEMFHGAELCFRQTADFNAPTQSSILDGRGYYGFEFAGSYDGDNHTINELYYVGDKDSKKDTKIGLFPIVSGDASIKNLTLANVNITRGFREVGALCGSINTKGLVTISNVKVSGSVTDGYLDIGGLIGYADGSLDIDGCDISVNVDGNFNCGGVIGSFMGKDLNVNDITTKSHRFLVNASEGYAGGVAGHVDAYNRLSFTNIKLEHTVSSEDSDVKIINGTLGAGGLFGRLDISGSSQALFENIDILCPVSVDDHCAGGLVGYLDMKANMKLSDCKVKSIVSGGSTGSIVGGWFGLFKSSKDYVMEFAGGDGVNSFEVDLGTAGIIAQQEGGGLFGELDCAPKMQGNRVKVAANVEVSDECAGGVVGSMEKTDLDISFFIINSTMRVTGNSKVGGLVGSSYDGSITDSKNPAFDIERTPQAYIPPKSQFPSTFSCMVEGKDYVGGIVGYSESFLYRLASAVTITARGSYAGGIAGYAGIYDGAPIQRCVFMGSLGCSGSYVGGIAGYLKNSVNGKTAGGFLRDCVNYSQIKGGNYTGGIVGNIDYSSGVRMELHWSVNLGRIDGGAPCGGLIGKCDGGGDVGMGMVGLANYGDVNSAGSDGSGVGGVIGRASSTRIAINGAMNKGNIHAEGYVTAIGGVVGVLGHDPSGAAVYQSHNGEMYWSANYGKVSCSNPATQVGGVCGWLEEGYSGRNDSYIHDCYNIGEVTTNHDSDTGGILGYVDHFGRIERCINFGNVSYGNATIGTHKPACIFYHSNLNMIEGTGKDWCADRKIKSSEQGQTSKYKGISFDNTNWRMTNGRPYLASNRFEDVVPPK